MSSILIFGLPSHARAFVEAIPSAYSVLVFGDDKSAWSDRGSLATIASLMQLPDDLCAVVDLTCDRTAKERVLGMIGDAVFAGVPLYTNALSMTATDAAARSGSDVAIAISYIPALFQGGTLLEAAPSLQTGAENAADALALLREITGRELEVVADRVGLVSARNLAMIINEAIFALMEGVASPEDIDVAMKLGTSYPEGPLRWADRIGHDIVLHVLQGLYDEYQEERYRPCVLLKQFVRAGKMFHPERVRDATLR